MKDLNILSKLIISFSLSAMIIFFTAAISLNSVEKIASSKILISSDDTSNLQKKILKEKSIQTALRQSRSLIIISSITGFILCIFIGFFTARSISLPLLTIQKKMEELAKGKIPEPIILVENSSNNEIFNIIKSLNKIISKQKSYF
ncbi:MAG: hypothetical protein RBR08_07865 [Desulforegulaceae bacterium]|nr:hypothetical protein [Desulforegulaceae bacterium]